MNNDRVNELYFGEISSDEGQRICRDRIHWMVSKIQGDRVLDIGCSQGITSILAARQGRQVVGVEVEEPAIEYARRAVAGEPEEVRARIRLVHADIFAEDLEGQRFDTVVLGEILEHLSEPRRLFPRAVHFLAPGGVIVVSTPFGYHPHHDHHFTFYLSDFVSTIEGHSNPVELEVMDGYLLFVGRRADESGPQLDLDAAELLARSERAFLAKEKAKHAVLSERKRELVRLAAENRRLVQRADALSAQARQHYNSWQKERARAADLAEKRDALRRKSAEQRDLIRKLRTLPPILPPPANAGRLSRGLSMVFGSLQHEIHRGRAFRRPHTALIKTFWRMQKAMRQAPALPPASPPQPAPAPTVEHKAVGFPPFVPAVAHSGLPVTIATILDTFSEFCFRYEADLVPLSVDAWQAEMERWQPSLLFAESAWLGNSGQWKYLMTRYAEKANNPLRDLLAWCREHGVPTVFWNKEDPANFEVFKQVAAEFDHVFTTDEQCIPRYRELLGHDRVYALPFAAQPAIHNPIQEAVKRERSVCFAGSWRARKYPERATDTETLLAPALEFGLDIFDRNAGSKKAEEFAFPPPYAGAVRGSLDYDSMLSAYRAYRTFLNVNSVKESPTMFARRVFELMACGTPVISSDSVGIRQMLGSLVKMAATPEETRAHLERLLGDADYRGRYAHAGYREVLEHHTYGHRLREILDRVGVDAPVAAPPPVTILAVSNRPARLDHLLGGIRRQVHPDLQTIIVLNSDDYDRGAVERAAADLANVKVLQLPQSYTLAECLNHGLDHAEGKWVAKLDDDDYYGAYYIADLLLATRYTDAPVLGKRNCFCYLEGSDELVLRYPDFAHRHVEYVTGATLFVRRDLFRRVRFSPVIQGTDTVFQRQCRELGIPIYSADPYNFIVFRHADARAHTWQIKDEQLRSSARMIGSGLNLDLVMV